MGFIWNVIFAFLENIHYNNDFARFYVGTMRLKTQNYSDARTTDVQESPRLQKMKDLYLGQGNASKVFVAHKWYWAASEAFRPWHLSWHVALEQDAFLDAFNWKYYLIEMHWVGAVSRLWCIIRTQNTLSKIQQSYIVQHICQDFQMPI